MNVHISTGHPELADYYYEILEVIEKPEILYQGNQNALLAVKSFEKPSDKSLIVVYKEVNDTDGFVITAYLTKSNISLPLKPIVWKLRK